MASRYWALFILCIAVLIVACVVNTVLVTRCWLSPACVPTAQFVEVSSYFNEIIWLGNRVATWLICGLAVQHILVTEAKISGPGMHPSKSMRGFGRCVAYLATLSATTYLSFWVAPLFQSVLSPTEIGRSAIGLLFRLFAISVWAYTDARFALFIATLISGGRAESFAGSWRIAHGSRGKLFMIFFLIEAGSQAAWFVIAESVWLRSKLAPAGHAIEGLTGMSRGVLEQRLPQIVEFSVFVVISDLFCAAAFFVAYRRWVALSPEVLAEVFG